MVFEVETSSRNKIREIYLKSSTFTYPKCTGHKTSAGRWLVAYFEIVSPEQRFNADWPPSSIVGVRCRPQRGHLVSSARCDGIRGCRRAVVVKFDRQGWDSITGQNQMFTHNSFFSYPYILTQTKINIMTSSLISNVKIYTLRKFFIHCSNLILYGNRVGYCSVQLYTGLTYQCGN